MKKISAQDRRTLLALLALPEDEWRAMWDTFIIERLTEWERTGAIVPVRKPDGEKYYRESEVKKLFGDDWQKVALLCRDWRYMAAPVV